MIIETEPRDVKIFSRLAVIIFLSGFLSISSIPSSKMAWLSAAAWLIAAACWIWSFSRKAALYTEAEIPNDTWRKAINLLIKNFKDQTLLGLKRLLILSAAALLFYLGSFFLGGGEFFLCRFPVSLCAASSLWSILYVSFNSDELKKFRKRVKERIERERKKTEG